MLTPEQIKKHKFRLAGKGLYKSDEVDAFFSEVTGAVSKLQENGEQLQKTNDELYQRVEALANALSQMRSERELIQKTMITAQKSADELTGKAKEESAALLQSAKTEAEKLRRNSQNEAAQLLSSSKAEVEKLLLEAQAHAENLQAQARARAEKLFDEARATAQEELVQISAQTQREQQRLERLNSECMAMRGKMMDFIEQQMKLVEEADCMQALPQEQQSKPTIQEEVLDKEKPKEVAAEIIPEEPTLELSAALLPDEQEQQQDDQGIEPLLAQLTDTWDDEDEH